MTCSPAPSTTCRPASLPTSSRSGGPGRTASCRTTSSASRSAAESPVLAHLFLNFMLEETIAYENFINWNGYIPPQKGIDADALIADGLIPETLAPAVVRPDRVPGQPGAAPADGRRRAALGPGLVAVQGGLAGVESRWTWRFLALPGVAWLSVFFLVSFYAVICVAFGNQNTLNEPVPIWNPLDWNVGYVQRGAPEHPGRRAVPDPLHPHVRVRGHRRRHSRCSSATRSPTTPRAMPGNGRAHPRAARAPLVDQLPHADAGLDQPALAGGLGHEGAALDVDRPAVHLARPARERGRLARGTAGDGDPRPGLRLRAFPRPSALRVARPDRPTPHRGGARPGRKPVPGLPPRDAAALHAGDPRRRSCSSLCRCSATTTHPISSPLRPKRS